MEERKQSVGRWGTALASVWGAGILAVCQGCSGVAPTTIDDEDQLGSQTDQLRSEFAKHALVITDLSVVNNGFRTADPCNSAASDADKAWTIGHMLKKEAQRYGLDPTTYVDKWLTAWTTSTTINGQTVPVNEIEGNAVRAAWTRLGGTSRLDKAPFRLLAIVSRFDLRHQRPSGEPLGGEVRFVFGILSPPSSGAITCPTPQSDVSTIILEYSPVRSDENAVQAWAQSWYQLGGAAFGSSYRQSLEALTEEVLNNGRLLRIRTNEGPGGTWFMTEFAPDSTHYLVRSTIKQSPTMDLATGTSTDLGRFIVDNILNLGANENRPSGKLYAPIGSYLVTDKFAGTNTWFRGSFNRLPSDISSSFWKAPNPGVDATTFSNARQEFSLGTCNGCHGRETQTGILHISPRAADSEARLSSFLSGPITVADPVTGTNRTLDEMLRREQDITGLVGGSQVGTPVFGNNYKLVAYTGRLCLTAGGTANGALVKTAACTGASNQRLSIVYQGSSNYNLKFQNSGKCVDIENASTATGARVIQNTCTNATSQRFTSRISSSGGSRTFQFIRSGMCIALKDQSSASGTQLVQVNCQYNDATDGLLFIE